MRVISSAYCSMIENNKEHMVLHFPNQFNWTFNMPIRHSLMPIRQKKCVSPRELGSSASLSGQSHEGKILLRSLLLSALEIVQRYMNKCNDNDNDTKLNYTAPHKSSQHL
jgi:hypothetical protein